MRVVNDPLTLIHVTTAERERIAFRYIYKQASGIFIARGRGSRDTKPLSITITGKTNLLEEAIENEEDERAIPLS